jgi:hypothetical protein
MWDQRIPNEPILERQFLLVRPPIVLQERPMQTSQPCKHSVPKLFNRRTEHRRAEYWRNNLITTEEKGIDTIGHSKPRNYKKLAEQYPDKPWLNGVSINIDNESKLFGLNTYNTKDCMSHEVLSEFLTLSRLSDETMVRNMQQQSVRMNEDGRLWNIATSLRTVESKEVI